MSKSTKIISGTLLLIIGAVIVFQSMALNLIEIILLLGFVLAVVGVILIIWAFIDIPGIAETDVLKEIVPSSNEKKSSSPLKVPKTNNNISNNKSKKKIKNSIPKFNPKDTRNTERVDPVIDSSNSKAVLKVTEEDDTPSFEDNQLRFTPNYEKPVRVTRKPKKRSERIEEEIFNKDLDKTNDIKRALNENVFEEKPKSPIKPDNLSPRDIKIDVNNPESLPVPEMLKSFVVTDRGTITSDEAFNDLTIQARNDIMLEIPNLKDLNDRFLSYIPTIHSRIIIEEFDVSNTSYVLLLSSLIKQNVQIRTLPKIEIINLITDNYAMIISDNLTDADVEFGAVYTDFSEIQEINQMFEKSWNLAKEIDRNIIKN
ncbi:hypothetical protein LJB96_00990 [Methanobrevibacter sp. OttesenSCG-928-K11]|nr:hypothetical protein [Methanobrevibacter sp. OttesenSCG-928-K11]MDL2270275.1 hypothetical protein [Methanobrevibacter sp. OttesenSCG-928-I08]